MNDSETAVDQNLQADADSLQQTMLRISWASQRRLRREMDQFGLTLPQFVALRALRRAGSCRMSELAEAAQQVLPTMTGIIDRLTERGLVERQRDPADRRSLRASLTAQGLELLDEIDLHTRQRLVKMMGSLSPDERSQILRLMQLYLEATLTDMED
jgi:DNA-binding MarR family transcriptional regulator